MKNFYIAGASSRSRTARVYIEYLNPDMKISAFLVSPEMTDNEPVVDGVPVVKITSSPDQIPSSCPPQSEESSQESVQEMVEGVEVVEGSDVSELSEDCTQKKLKNGGIPILRNCLRINCTIMTMDLASSARRPNEAMPGASSIEEFCPLG